MSNQLMQVSHTLTVAEVVAQRETILSLMKSGMTEGQHYGKIPGCGDKPSLYQSGAQGLGMMFRLRPEYVIKEKDFEGEHREYEIICKLFHQGSGGEVGQGVGICSTRESKYRYRNAAKEVTWLDGPVPSLYWTMRNKFRDAVNPQDKERFEGDLNRWLGTVFQGKDVSIIGTKKDERQQWRFVEFHGGEGKVENENIADVFNTVLKMAKKRAFVDAIITATASNDLFTQDLEDIQANLNAVVTVKGATPEEKNVTPPGEGKPEDAFKGGSSTVGEQAVKHNAATTPAKQETKPGPEGVQTWKDVVCHIGTVNGKVHGRKLGAMAKSTTDWLEKQMVKIDKPSKQDSLLIAALAMMNAEREVMPESNIGKGVEVLRTKCEAKKISLASIVAVNKEVGGNADAFVNITPEEADYLLKNWDITEKLAIEIGDDIPMV